MDVIKFPSFERKPVVVIDDHSENITEPKVRLLPIVWRPLQKLTEEQYEALPETFRCFFCLQQYPRKKIGGIEVEQYICRFCYPYVGEGWVRRMISWSLRRNHPVRGF